MSDSCQDRACMNTIFVFTIIAGLLIVGLKIFMVAFPSLFSMEVEERNMSIEEVINDEIICLQKGCSVNSCVVVDIFSEPTAFCTNDRQKPLHIMTNQTINAGIV